ncbi:MAG: FliA/WhiG family RNA polymerase sigma factor [Thermoguttaceae bacterium]
MQFIDDPSDKYIRNSLIERFMPIVRSRAERIWARLPEGIDLDDLISAGTFGLMDAINAFDPNRGVKFETFCMPRVQGAMLDELRSMDWVPRMVRSKASRINEAFKTLEFQLGRKPYDMEIAEYLNIPVAELPGLLAETHGVNITSLDKKWGETDGFKDIREVDILADQRSEDPTERLSRVDLIRSFTRGLTKNERLIVILYYYEEMTMKEIGQTLDLSESRVSQMHSSIVDRIKRMHQERYED